MSLRVKILGADSIGVRSMATLVEAGGYRIFIDPGVSFAPRRYGLPPHPRELSRLEEVRERIIDSLRDSDIIIITHYHYDHYLYKNEDLELYNGKILIVKNPRTNINTSQKLRAYRLLVKGKVAEKARKLEYIDFNTVKIDKTITISGSPPAPHGPEGTRLGYVVMVSIEYNGQVFIHASDVQGPTSTRALEWILEQKPATVFISGPPTYFAGYKVPLEEVRQGFNNLETLAQKLEATIIVDHHMARDLKYPEYLRMIGRKAKGRILSASEYMGAPYEPLEALRNKLWEEDPPNSNRASRRRTG